MKIYPIHGYTPLECDSQKLYDNDLWRNKTSGKDIMTWLNLETIIIGPKRLQKRFFLLEQ